MKEKLEQLVQALRDEERDDLVCVTRMLEEKSGIFADTIKEKERAGRLKGRIADEIEKILNSESGVTES